MKKWLFFCLPLAMLCFACADDDGGSPPGDDERRLVVHLPRLVFDETTTTPEASNASRTVVLCEGNPTFSWMGNEAVAIYPSDGYPKLFQCKGKISPNEATFANIKEKLVPGNTYYAFTPYADILAESTPSTVHFSYDGQRIDRFLTLNDTITHLAAYDYLFAEAQVPLDAQQPTHFYFTRVGALVRVQLTLPDAHATYKRMVLTAKEEPATDLRFVVSGDLNMTKKNTGFAATIEAAQISNVQKSSEMVIEFADIQPTDETGLTMYPAFMLYPGDKRYGFDLRLEYVKDGVPMSKHYHLNGYIYKANHYYQQVALDAL